MTKKELSFDDHVRLARAYRTNGQLFDAVLEFKRALELQPDNLDIIQELETSYEELGKKEKAEQIYRFFTRKGMRYIQEENYLEALLAYQALLHFAPWDKNVIRSILDLMYRLERYKEGVQLYTEYETHNRTTQGVLPDQSIISIYISLRDKANKS